MHSGSSNRCKRRIERSVREEARPFLLPRKRHGSKNDNARRTFRFPEQGAEVQTQRVMLKEAGIISSDLFPDPDGKPLVNKNFIRAWKWYWRYGEGCQLYRAGVEGHHEEAKIKSPGAIRPQGFDVQQPDNLDIAPLSYSAADPVKRSAAESEGIPNTVSLPALPKTERCWEFLNWWRPLNSSR